MKKRTSKTGGGPGTNQHAIKGVSKGTIDDLVVDEDLAALLAEAEADPMDDSVATPHGPYHHMVQAGAVQNPDGKGWYLGPDTSCAGCATGGPCVLMTEDCTGHLHLDNLTLRPFDAHVGCAACRHGDFDACYFAVPDGCKGRLSYAKDIGPAAPLDSPAQIEGMSASRHHRKAAADQVRAAAATISNHASLPGSAGSIAQDVIADIQAATSRLEDACTHMAVPDLHPEDVVDPDGITHAPDDAARWDAAARYVTAAQEQLRGKSGLTHVEKVNRVVTATELLHRARWRLDGIGDHHDDIGPVTIMSAAGHLATTPSAAAAEEPPAAASVQQQHRRAARNAARSAKNVLATNWKAVAQQSPYDAAMKALGQLDTSREALMNAAKAMPAPATPTTAASHPTGGDAPAGRWSDARHHITQAIAEMQGTSGLTDTDKATRIHRAVTHLDAAIERLDGIITKEAM